MQIDALLEKIKAYNPEQPAPLDIYTGWLGRLHRPPYLGKLGGVDSAIVFPELAVIAHHRNALIEAIKNNPKISGLRLHENGSFIPTDYNDIVTELVHISEGSYSVKNLITPSKISLRGGYAFEHLHNVDTNLEKIKAYKKTRKPLHIAVQSEYHPSNTSDTIIFSKLTDLTDHQEAIIKAINANRDIDNITLSTLVVDSNAVVSSQFAPIIEKLSHLQNLTIESQVNDYVLSDLLQLITIKQLSQFSAKRAGPRLTLSLWGHDDDLSKDTRRKNKENRQAHLKHTQDFCEKIVVPFLQDNRNITAFSIHTGDLPSTIKTSNALKQAIMTHPTLTHFDVSGIKKDKDIKNALSAHQPSAEETRLQAKIKTQPLLTAEDMLKQLHQHFSGEKNIPDVTNIKEIWQASIDQLALTQEAFIHSAGGIDPSKKKLITETLDFLENSAMLTLLQNTLSKKMQAPWAYDYNTNILLDRINDHHPILKNKMQKTWQDAQLEDVTSISEKVSSLSLEAQKFVQQLVDISQKIDQKNPKIIKLQKNLSSQCDDATKKLDAIINDPHASATDKEKAKEIRQCVETAKIDPSNSKNTDKLTAYAKEAQNAPSATWKKVGITLLAIAATCIVIASILLAVPTFGTSIAAGVTGGLGIAAAVSGTGLFKKGSVPNVGSVANTAKAIEEETRLGKHKPHRPHK